MPTNASRLQKQNHPRHLNRFLPHNGSPVPSIPPFLLEAPAPKSIRARLLPPLRSAPLAKQAGASATLLRSSLFSTPPPRQPLPPLVAVSPDPIPPATQRVSAPLTPLVSTNLAHRAGATMRSRSPGDLLLPRGGAPGARGRVDLFVGDSWSFSPRGRRTGSERGRRTGSEGGFTRRSRRPVIRPHQGEACRERGVSRSMFWTYGG